MLIKEIMTKSVETVRPDAILAEAAGKMKQLNVGALPVYDGELLMGMLTDRDIVVRSTANGDDPKDAKVKDVMSTEVQSCYDDEELDAVAEQMKAKKVRRIPVITRENSLAGMVSLGDIADRGNSSLAEETLEKVSEPSEPER
ncbi:MAG: CBS domain-containing protein [Candidatus Omnitrophica bacterium]|nr:CBS domain-containing protein [Candidatus Omnitrophota bacterium]